MKLLLLAASLMAGPRPDLPLPGVTITLSTGQQAVTDANGEYALEVPHGWTGQITPSLVGYKFEPQWAYADKLSGDAVINFQATAARGKGKK